MKRIRKRSVLRVSTPALPALLLAAAMAVLMGAGGSEISDTASASESTTGAAGMSHADSQRDIIPGRYIVVLKDGASVAEVAARHGVTPQVVYEHAVNGFAGSITDQAVSALEADTDVLAIEPDRVVRLTDQRLATGVNRIDVEENATAAINGVDANGGQGLDVDIAVIDTGIDLDHPDLRVAGGKRFTFDSCSDGSFDDDHGHGTHVAGVAAARDNGFGVVGVAPGARVWAVKVFHLDAQGDATGSFSCVNLAIDWVTGRKKEFNDGAADGDPGVNFAVANMSLGSTLPTTDTVTCSFVTSAAAAGVINVVAAGNSTQPADLYTPAKCSAAITVSAIADSNGQPGGGTGMACGTDLDDTFADFSNHGPAVDIAAPGVCIYSTLPPGSCALCHWSSYGTLSGTSMASPHVAGAVALFKLATGYSGSANGRDVVDALESAGWTKPQSINIPSGGCAFTQDPDPFLEPLIWVGTECPGDSVIPPQTASPPQPPAPANARCTSGLTCSLLTTLEDGQSPNDDSCATGRPCTVTTRICIIQPSAPCPPTAGNLGGTQLVAATTGFFPAAFSFAGDSAIVDGAVVGSIVIQVRANSAPSCGIDIALPGNFQDAHINDDDPSTADTSNASDDLRNPLVWPNDLNGERAAIESRFPGIVLWSRSVTTFEVGIARIPLNILLWRDPSGVSGYGWITYGVTGDATVLDAPDSGLGGNPDFDDPSPGGGSTCTPLGATAVTNGVAGDGTVNVTCTGAGTHTFAAEIDPNILLSSDEALRTNTSACSAGTPPPPCPSPSPGSPPSPSASPATFIVNSTADCSDALAGDGVCETAPTNGICTLRAAIQEANANGLTDNIHFNIPAATDPGCNADGLCMILPNSELPEIVAPVVIDGYTQPGSTPNTNGPLMDTSAVLKIVLNGANAGPDLPTGGSQNLLHANGLHLSGGGSTVRGLEIRGFAGLVPGGLPGGDDILLTGPANTIQGNIVEGLEIDAQSNVIGGTAAEARNRIFSLDSASGAGLNLIQGNSISSTWIASADNTIGGAASGSGNLIGGLDLRRNLHQGATVAGNVVQGNRVTAGIEIDGKGNAIGGTAPGAGNEISGNNLASASGANVRAGVVVHNAASTGNLVQGNDIHNSGTSSLSCNDGGVNLRCPAVLVLNGSGNSIGGTAPGAGNVIHGNIGVAVVIWDDDAPQDPDGRQPAAVSNAILGNSIYANTGGIVLVNGGNNNSAAPSITSAVSDGTQTIVQGSSAAGRLEFFSSVNTNCQGKTFLGFIDHVTGTFSITLPPVPLGQRIAATRTDAANNTSPFGCRTVIPPGDLDEDTIVDASDNCPLVYNPGQENADGDALGNVCDTEGPRPNANGLGGADDCQDGVDNDADGKIDAADTNCLCPAVPLPPPADAATERVSLGCLGQGNLDSGLADAALSADGRFVAFTSHASNLVNSDTNARSDVFVRDRQTGTTTRVSLDSNGSQPDSDSSLPSISADGRYVGFISSASNLVLGDSNAVADVFVHDRQTGVTTRVSVDSAGVQANGSGSDFVDISADGRYVAFSSWATNLVVGDTNLTRDVFVHDRQTAATTRVSVSSAGLEGRGSSGSGLAISGDGRFVAFESSATLLVAPDTNLCGLVNCSEIYVHDRQTGATTRVSVNSSGAESNGNSVVPAISGDGRYVGFRSFASNLVSGDTNGRSDILVHDRQTATTTRVSLDSLGVQANDDSSGPAISADGRFIAFESEATNLVPGDTNSSGCFPNCADIFVRDRQSNATTRVNVDSTGAQADRDSASAAISADGRYVAFTSLATNLVADDTNGQRDTFLRDRDQDSDGVFEPLDNCPDAANAGQENTDDTLATGGASVAGDASGDACDADDDNDSAGALANRATGPCAGTGLPLFDDCVEAYLGTNPLDNCVLGPGTNGDAWPPDLAGDPVTGGPDGDVDTADIAVLTGNFGKVVPTRADLTTNGSIDTADIAILTGLFGDRCT